MDPRMNPHGSRQEYNFGERDGSRQANIPGVYYHPGADAFVETAYAVQPNGQPAMKDGKVVYDQANGRIQADAFVQIGYRLATDEEVKRFRSQQQAQAKAIKATQTSLRP